VRTPLTRRVTVRVTAAGITVTAPRGCAVSRVERMLRADPAWLADALERIAAGTQPPPAHGMLLPYLDGGLTVVAGAGGRAVRRDGDRLLVPYDPPRRDALERWYRAEARRHLGALVEAWSPRLGVRPSGLVVRGQRSRWGSASARGSIALNWRLMLAPWRVGEYVVVHELCHLVHMDHSPRFWALVTEHWPGHREDRDWLRRHGPAALATLSPSPRVR